MKSIMMRSGRETGKKKEIADDDDDWVVWGRSGRSMMMLVSAILRVVLIVYGEWQDTHMDVHYTDIDYLVFSDAASLMASSKSPYQRSTFRYSPLLPLLLIPNSLLYASWGKLLFSAADLLTGHLIYCILTLRGVPKKQSIACEAAWLFNPFTFTIGTRGNCEPVVCAIILCFLLCLMKDKIIQAGLWYGLVVHFRIYPIIYCLSILIILDCPHQFLNSWTPEQSDKSSISFLNFRQLLFGINFKNILALFNRKRIQFAIVSGGCFFLLTGICYLFYGHEFLNEALLYHLTRTDHRHNFSIYFYHIYLHHEHDFTLLERLLAFLPQFTVQLVLIFFFAKDFIFCIFVQTLAFVAFNKVITAQYFVWFFCLLPLILPWTKLRIRWNGLICILVWISAQIHWLGWAYLLEFKGINVFVQLWLASIVFLMANTSVLVVLIANHKFSPLFGKRILVSSNLDAKKKE